MKNKIKVLFAAIILALVGSSCGLKSSGTNELCLIYSGGVFEDKSYQGLLKPGATNKSTGYGSKTYCYRTDQRSYIANSQNNGADAAPVTVVSQDDVRMSVDYQLYFKINQDEKILKRFHENLGIKTKAWTKDGWVQLLREYFEPQIERSLEQAALLHNWRDLYATEEARATFNQETIANLKKQIREVIGDDYFCGPTYDGTNDCGDFTFTVGKPQPTNGDIIDAIEAEQTAKTRAVAQAQENERIRVQLEAERTIVDLYGPQGALLREALRSGKVQIMVVPQGSDVAVPANGNQE